MIELSNTQCRDYAIPLIYECMGELVGQKAEAVWAGEEGEQSGLFGWFDGDRLVGIVGVGSELSKRKVWLGYFAVHPGYRRKGLGMKMLAFVEGVMRQRGYREIFIETYDHPTFEAACALYEKAGYRRVGELPEFLDDGSDALFYRKKLNPE